MKLKKCIFLVVVVLFVTAFFTYSGEDDYPTIDNTVFDNPQRPAATESLKVNHDHCIDSSRRVT